jgi:hypothetical protein
MKSVWLALDLLDLLRERRSERTPQAKETDEQEANAPQAEDVSS